MNSNTKNIKKNKTFSKYCILNLLTTDIWLSVYSISLCAPHSASLCLFLLFRLTLPVLLLPLLFILSILFPFFYLPSSTFSDYVCLSIPFLLSLGISLFLYLSLSLSLCLSLFINHFLSLFPIFSYICHYSLIFIPIILSFPNSDSYYFRVVF